MKTITITIDKEAKVTLETDGYAGKACAIDSKIIQDALGMTTKDVKKKEYSMDSVTNQSIGGGC